MSSWEVPHLHKGDKRYARRDNQGQLTEKQVNVGESLASDLRTGAKTTVPKGQGDQGDEERG